ncbi:MAG: PQQ-binding-like beta-propeller repeat protein [Candidatus Hydrogenedentes bacterium]|nr:PQQ-binding-like beta-propeller repeat protein [Candidatus Hydrogenedentota bacterium]
MFVSPWEGPYRISFVLVASVMLAAVAGAVDELPFWPQFHGPKRDNISTEKGLLDAWPEGGPARVWTAEGLGHGYSTVAIAGGMMYTSGNIDGSTVVTALDMEGEILWQVNNGAAWTQDRPGTRGTPTVDGDRVYHESPLGNVMCLDAKTGEIIWQLNILDKFDSENIHWGLAESLLIDGDKVICSPGGPEASMVALNKHTGAVVWISRALDGGRADRSSARPKNTLVVLRIRLIHAGQCKREKHEQ